MRSDGWRLERYIGEGAFSKRLPYAAFFWYFSWRDKKSTNASPINSNLQQGSQWLPCFYDTAMIFRMAPMAPFSSRDTWAREMPSTPATSIWVRPS